MALYRDRESIACLPITRRDRSLHIVGAIIPPFLELKTAGQHGHSIIEERDHNTPVQSQGTGAL
jgi:hypothetical protein